MGGVHRPQEAEQCDNLKCNPLILKIILKTITMVNKPAWSADRDLMKQV